MNRFRLLAIGTMLLFALATTAQQPTRSASTKGTSAGEHAGIPTAEAQLTFLAAKLDLSRRKSNPSCRSCTTQP